MQWLQGFERIEGVGEELSADEMVVSFHQEPPAGAMRILFEVNGKRLTARIKAAKTETIEQGSSKVYRCTCRFSVLGPRERGELNEVLEHAPDPPYRRERVERPKRSPLFRSRRRRAEAVVVAPEIEAKIVAFLAQEKRVLAPGGTQRPLIAIKEAERITEETHTGMRYRVRSRIVNSHGVTKNFDTQLFVPDKGEVRILE